MIQEDREKPPWRSPAWFLPGCRLFPLRREPRWPVKPWGTPANSLPSGRERGGWEQRPLPINEELTRLGLIAGDLPVITACATGAVFGLNTIHQPKAAAELGLQAIAALEAAGQSPPLALLAFTARAQNTNGDGEGATATLAKGENWQTDEQIDPSELSPYLFDYGNILVRSGRIDEAMQIFHRLIEVEKSRNNLYQQTVAQGQIADILFARGMLDQALRIREEGNSLFTGSLATCGPLR
jgi:tetratricopeptide (TPR) repeat protein